MAEWNRKGAYWSEKQPNAWGQPAVLNVMLELAQGGDPDGRLGVFIETWMCETFLLPEAALVFAKRIERAARQALAAEQRRGGARDG